MRNTTMMLWSNSGFQEPGAGTREGCCMAKGTMFHQKIKLIMISKSGSLIKRGNKASLVTCSRSKKSDVFFWANIKEYVFPYSTLTLTYSYASEKWCLSAWFLDWSVFFRRVAIKGGAPGLRVQQYLQVQCDFCQIGQLLRKSPG